MAADLPEFQERIQYFYLASCCALFGKQFANALIHGGADGLIQIFLLAIQLNVTHDLGFFRQLRGYLIFRAPQHKWSHPTAQLRITALIALFFNRFSVVFAEDFLVCQVARQNKIKQGP